jgi:glycyl-tRNA synthetase beta chain
MAEFFLEIGSEEIPSSYIPPALSFLEKEVSDFFSKNRIEAGSHKVFGTPRRLAIAFDDVDDKQEDIVETHYGPNVKVAFDAEGKPQKSAIGFARGKGVDVSELTRESTPKGEVICARVEKKGQLTETLLNEFLPGLINRIPFPKKMRWADKTTPFPRPLHWIAALFGDKNLNFEFAGIQSQPESKGHRFLNPETFRFTNLQSYLDACEKHFIIVDPERRKQIILQQASELAEEVGGVVQIDPELLQEVNHLVEYPVAIRGDFDSRYLELPKELLVMTMKVHQKYFPVAAKDGKLLPHFITISNIKSQGGDEIRRGNERVLRARLEDARFFYDEDRKKNLEDFVAPLKDVLFQKTLGTSYEKMTRFRELGKYLANLVCPEKASLVERAATLCKADLVSQMVYEFPELQGIMGSYYALHSGEDAAVAEAIKEHYRPAFAGDEPAHNPVGAVVAVSDKLDTILGCIGVGLIPTGSEDPYALRRHSLGIIQTMLHHDWKISFDDLIAFGIDQLKDKIKLSPEEIRSHTLELFTQRYKSLLADYPYDAIDAVLSTGIDSLVDVRQKVVALSELKKQPYFEALATAFRRVVSILNEEAKGEVDPKHFQEPQEKALYEKFLEIHGPVESLILEKQFSQALEKIVEIKPEVDSFFDKVMVMVEDENQRKNRLHLLYQISCLFSGLADFSKIVVGKR